MLDLAYPRLLDLFPQCLDPKRSESASFLIWYLENYYRLDDEEAVAAVCDQRGDRGVDGVFVNDGNQTITIFQAKISQKANVTIGDASLREFEGTLAQFADAASLQAVMQAARNVQLGQLIQRLDLVNKIGTHELRAEFLSNVDLDQNGANFLKVAKRISFIGARKLASTYISDKRDPVVHATRSFDIGGFTTTDYAVDGTTHAAIAPLKALELVKLEGIENQSLFAYNVRGSLGKTGVNRSIAASIGDPKLHKLFPLFHNGITIICKKLDVAKEKLTVEDYFVINGCQSITALFMNAAKLTEDLRILTKVIQMDPASDLAAMVTKFSNNQNGVSNRDFMSNNEMQVRLQNEFKSFYSGQYVFEIKRGEEVGVGQKISNEDAGLYLMAFDLKEPWGTHRKYQVFESKYPDIFGRPEVTADRIVFCQVIVDAIDEASRDIQNKLFGKYRLTRYMLLYIVREILEKDTLGAEVLRSPGEVVRAPAERERFKSCMLQLLSDVVIDVNDEVEDDGEDFDYRGKLRDSSWVQNLTRTVVKDHLKQIVRGRIRGFGLEWGGGLRGIAQTAN